jgi:hypothetical protein
MSVYPPYELLNARTSLCIRHIVAWKQFDKNVTVDTNTQATE